MNTDSSIDSDSDPDSKRYRGCTAHYNGTLEDMASVKLLVLPAVKV